jgi:hypothetical protein
VYDTSRDSDGGAWRKRTQNTSWYNEELNTATRGARREFPAVAVIVAEADKVTIYDGDDPDLSMWMVINQIGSWSNIFFSCLYCLNGKLVIGSGSGYTDVCFIKERMSKIHPAAEYTGDYIWNELTYNPLYVIERPGLGIVNNVINDVAMTVLPNAPIDEDTGLLVPTIAVATDGGVSVIKDDGTVVDIVSDNLNGETPLEVDFRGRLLYLLLGSKESVSNTWNSVSTIYIPDDDVSTTYRYSGDYIAQYSRYNGLPSSEPANSGHDMLVPINSQTHLPTAQRSRAINVLGTDHLYIGGEGSEDKAGGVAAISENLTNPKNGLIAHTTSRYNTGWMPGDIKLAALSDSFVENVGVNSDELVENGDFSTALGDEWSDESTGTGSISLNASGYIDLISQGSSNRAIADQSFSTVIGKTYTLSLDVIATDGNSSVYLGTSAGANDITSSALNLLSLGAHGFTFVATTTTTFIRLWGSTESSTNSFDNISVRLAVEDRSVNGNGLQIVGEIQKTPVAPGADLVAYSGFSANNYLVQPYNADLNFGTGDFCVMGWHYDDYLSHLHSATDAQKSVSITDSSNNFVLFSGNVGRIDFAVGGDNYNGVINSVLIDNLWQLVTFARKNNVLKVYVDDKVVYEVPDSSQNVSNIGGDLYLGGYWHNGAFITPGDSKSALLRISSTAPTAEQIAKIYRDEKVLFTEGAQATLYGTSDAVTALAYDDSEQLLHVGTASGRSDFRGLARVNNTTTAISNSISAAEGTIIQN